MGVQIVLSFWLALKFWLLASIAGPQVCASEAHVPVPEPSPPQYHSVPVPVKVTDPGKVREMLLFIVFNTAL